MPLRDPVPHVRSIGVGVEATVQGATLSRAQLAEALLL